MFFSVGGGTGGGGEGEAEGGLSSKACLRLALVMRLHELVSSLKNAVSCNLSSQTYSLFKK